MLRASGDRGRFLVQPWLLGAWISGAILRLACPGWLAVEHYDEGVYASNLVFLEIERGEYPGRALYAPPLWPVVIEFFTIAGQLLLGGAPVWWPMLPGILCGIALIPSVAWIMNRWFGPRAAMIAAWLVSLSEFHALYSRTALTDAPLILAWMWAVAGIAVALERGDLRSAVIAGVITAIGWWTKYSGWLPMAIGLSGGAAAQLMLPVNARSWKRYGRTMSVVVGVAVLLWLPVLWDCQSVGGYGVVAANHRGYVEPWSNWWTTLVRQGANLDTYSGSMSGLGLLLGIGAACCADGRPQGRPAILAERSVQVVFAAAVVIGIALYLAGVGGALSACLAGGLGGIGLGLVRWQQGRLTAREILAASLLSAWLLGLWLATPHYYPYPRLLLPLWLPGVLASAWSLAHCLAPTSSVTVAPAVIPGWLRYCIATAVVVMVALTATLTRPRCWEDRTDVFRASEEIAKVCRAASQNSEIPVVFVYNEPALLLHLRQAGLAAALNSDLKFAAFQPEVATFQVAGLFANTDAGYQQEWERFGDRFEPLQSWSIRPSSVRLLDYFSPAVLRDRPDERERTITLYRLLPR